MFDLEQEIAGWRRQMLDAGIKTPAPLDELESHLRDDLEQQMRSGLSAQRVFEAAVGRIGQVKVLQAEFANAAHTRRLRLRKYLWPAVGFGLGAFLIGAFFCQLALIPLALRSSKQYATWMGFTDFHLDPGAYISFVFKFELATGCAFAMSAGLLFMVRLGILDYKELAGFRRRVIVVNLVLGALLTTPEVVTQILMFIVLQLLYEAGVWISRHWQRASPA